jgi:hypothetical protein
LLSFFSPSGTGRINALKNSGKQLLQPLHLVPVIARTLVSRKTPNPNKKGANYKEMPKHKRAPNPNSVILSPSRKDLSILDELPFTPTFISSIQSEAFISDKQILYFLCG